MTMRIDVAIIGAGQAGLAMSRCLTVAGIDHLLIERGRVGERWRSERWPSLRLLTPNWMTRLPGPVPDPSDPAGFMRSAAFVRLLEDYRSRISAPVIAETEVLSIAPGDRDYRVTTTSGSILARAVVIATGACDRPAVPAWSRALSPDLHQITPDRYRSADRLPDGGVLVVGASATGAQLARAIHRSGRAVTLAAGRHVRAPRRYRGRDIFEWLDASGFLADLTPEDADMRRLRSQPSLQLAGDHAEGELGLHRLSAEGIRIVGRAQAAAGTKIGFATDLPVQCAAAEARRQKLLARIDAHIEMAGLAAPSNATAWEPPGALPAAPSAIDLGAVGIRTIVWATGYRRLYPWLKLPVLDRDGEIVHRQGVTPAPGLFVLGLPFQRHRASAFIDGVGRDAEALATAISRHLKAPIPLAA